MIKRGISIFLIFMLTIQAAIVSNSEVLTSAETVQSNRSGCTEHVFTRFIGYHSGNNQHTFQCANSGCNAYLVEECYTREYCVEHQDVETLQCDKCGYGTISIHNYVVSHIYSDDDYYHILRCINCFEDFGECGKTYGDYVECDLGEVQIWRGFKVNYGHYLSRTCNVCDFYYDYGYYYPLNHPNYFSTGNDCIYCQMVSPYHMDFDLNQ